MRTLKSLFEDERAIEGMPIRLVIAVLVGVAALTVMMGMINGLPTLGSEEVHVEIEYPSGNVLETSESGDMTISVLDSEGQEVQNAQVLVTGGTAQLEDTDVISKSTGSSSNEVTITWDDSSGGDPSVDLRSEQTKGTLTIEVIPPTDSNYADEQSNSEIVVVEG